LPRVGHQGSKTKGARVYGCYIDTAGLLDTEGNPAAICNAIAISMITRMYSPDRLIVMIRPSIFDERCQGFLDLTRTLRRCVRNLTHPETLSSILFVVSDPMGMRGTEFVLGQIGKAIEIRKETLNKTLQQVAPNLASNLMHMFEQFGLGSSGDPETICPGIGAFGEQNPDVAKSIADQQEDILFLELVLKQKQIVTVHFENSESRERIERWKAAPGSLSRDSFSMEHLKERGFAIFKEVLMTVTSYFNILHRENKELLLLINNSEEERCIKSSIQYLQSAIASDSNPEEQIKQARQRKKELEIERERHKKELYAPKKNSKTGALEEKSLVEQIAEIKAEINYLQESEDEKPLQFIEPTEPIVPRAGWAFLNKWAKTYQFEHDTKGHYPLVGASLQNPHGAAYQPFFGEQREGMKSGKYSVYYRPRWWGYKEDAQACVGLAVKTKDHPGNKSKVVDLEKKLLNNDHQPPIGLEVDRENLERQISGCNTQIENCDAIINQTDAQEEQRRKDQELLATKEAELKVWGEKRKAHTKRLEDVDRELSTFANFYRLLAQAIRPLDPNTTSRLERETFEQFIQAVESLSAGAAAASK